MRQKILYIILMIASLMGRNGLVWGQDGYTPKSTGPYTRSETFNDNYLDEHTLKLSQTNNIKENVAASVTFSFGDNVKQWFSGSGFQLYISKGNRENTINWTVEDKFYINVTGFSTKIKTRLGGGTVTFTPTSGEAKKLEISRESTNTITMSPNLGNSGSIKVSISGSTTSPYYYIQSLSYTYTLSYYELDISALQAAITKARGISADELNENIKNTFIAALNAANTVMAEAAFPTSYWYNGEKGQQTPTTVNNATTALNNAIDLAKAYIEAKRYLNDKGEAAKDWPAGLTVNTADAMAALEKTTAVAEINDAKNLIKVELNRNLPSGYFFTATFPFDYNISGIKNEAGETAYVAQLALVTHNKQDGYTLYFRQVDGGQMRANQPYVVFLPNGVHFDAPVNFGNPEIEFDTPGSMNVNGWTMQGNYETGLSMVGKYGIAGGKLCLGGEGSYINAYTAYFTHIPTTKNVQTRVAILNEQGDTTRIGDVKGGVLLVTKSVNSPDSVQHKQSRKSINIVRTKDGAARKILK